MQRVEKLIFDQADRSPDAVAVEHNGARLSYRQLKSEALNISYELRKSGLTPGQTVAIYQPRSLATVPLLLGVWEAGGLILPINQNTPAKVLEKMIQDAAPRIILTDPTVRSHMPESVSNIKGRKPARNDLNDCYIIYTSGSEGWPKGVVGTHQSLAHYLSWQAKEFAVNETDRFSQAAPLSFDFSFKELLVPLLCGARVCIADRTIVINARKFVNWVEESGITVMCCVPTLLRSILHLPAAPSDRDVFRSLRALLISGDMLRWEDVCGWRSRFGGGADLYNLYGPTESTVIKLFYPIPETKSPGSINVPVGRPIPDADIVIVDERNRLSAPGEVGEVVILSDWLARGYLNDNQPADGPFCNLEYMGKERSAYRSGDLGRWLSDGNLELMGRKDRQVKIRGYRIELNEIESILSSHPEIRDVAAVTTNGSDPDGLAMITCFFTTEKDDVTEKDVKSFAKERMLPQVLSLTRFRRIDSLPLMANGKVDRLKLESLIEPDVESSEQAAPNGLNVQEKISALWEELLSVEGIHVEANFFELGGDSMTAIRLLRRLREELHPEVKLDDVYECPSISQLSNRVAQLLA